VTERLNIGLPVSEIVNDVCKKCLSDNPRQTAGIGGDNVTCLIVLLKDESPYHEL
jgi:hypothetical protein